MIHLQTSFSIVSHNLIDKIKYRLDRWTAEIKQVFLWEQASVFPVLDIDGSSKFLLAPHGTHHTKHSWTHQQRWSCLCNSILKKDKEALERGEEKGIREKHHTQVRRTFSMTGQACPSRDSSLWRILQKKIFPNGNMIYEQSHTNTVTPSKGLHPVEEEWERRSSREKPLPQLTVAVVSLKGLSLKYSLGKASMCLFPSLFFFPNNLISTQISISETKLHSSESCIYCLCQ